MLNRIARIHDFFELTEELAYIRSTGYSGEHDTICYDYVYKWTKMLKCCKILDLLGEGRQIVEMGGGLSPIQYILANHGCQVINIDINFTTTWFPTIDSKYYARATPEFIIESERNISNIKRMYGDALQLLKKMPSHSMDAVVDTCSLHTFLGDGSILDEISRVLKCGGYLISIGDIANPYIGKCDEEFLYPMDMAKMLSRNKNLQLLEPYDYDTWEDELKNDDNLVPRKNMDYTDLSLLNMKTHPSATPYKNIPFYPIHIWTGIFVLRKK